MSRSFVVLLLLWAATARAQSQSIFFGVDCPPLGVPAQLCGAVFETAVTTGSRLQVRYIPAPLHCSSVRVHISLDGQPAATTPFVTFAGAGPPFATLPRDSGWVELSPVLPGTHVITLQGEGRISGCNRGRLFSWGGTLEIFLPPRIVAIDIKPGSDDNPIRLGSNGSTPFAILGAADFDVTSIDARSVTLAGAPVLERGNGEPMASIEDVNGDGHPDLVLHVSTGKMDLDSGDTTATMRGRTDVEEIEGQDVVRVK